MESLFLNRLYVTLMFTGWHNVPFLKGTKSHLNLNGYIFKNVVNVEDLILSEPF